ncbi:hypothetical protein GCM10023187_33320 [Nibrella viscosa]|uniref:Gliding motility-associated C-terminal domain-containing protein n=2 Tax=Nibrella viscosa TaxID=1084524 RepID=A0ABP8KM32_9BACT
MLILLLWTQIAAGQFCRNGSATVVFTQTFGSGSNRPSLASQTRYDLVTDRCPNDGQYNIQPAVSGSCYTNSWHDVPQDHTPGDINGNMLVLNAAYIGEIFTQPLPAVCQSATYEFSFWLLNLNLEMPPGTCGILVPHNPNLTLQVVMPDGTILRTFSTGTIQRTKSPVWYPFSFTFSVPADTGEVLIRFINNELGGCGNDFVLDDLQVIQCGQCRYPRLFIPDAFTPNNDGINDALDIIGQDIATYMLTIYNRWGTVIFVSNTLDHKWDGTYQGQPCEGGIYAVKATFEHADNTGPPQQFISRKQVLLIR